ncbi:hypothetical protein AMS68_006682 [Peltaster fructicola]|uniref:CREG-like beta-barrel domain-containing protein n=1 Tax=Peltaster fructicola TaxID=286661 RepID=A0A6H0Y2L5_9PEZI|nr:hypothetical protein AMS68_006682 [Peltaster fructicola]
MRLSLTISTLLSAVSAFSRKVPAQEILQTNDAAPTFDEPVAQDIPTIHESAVMARRIAELAAHGDLVTTFPTHSSSYIARNDFGAEALPSGLESSPIGMIEYLANCESGTGNPTMLAIDIATPYRNYQAGSNISLSIRWWPAEKNFYAASWWSKITGKAKRQDIPTPHTPAALPRISLHGRLERIPNRGLDGFYLAQCFVRKHPDSVYWQPNAPGAAHESHYVRFVVEQVYWFGGFGDRARIGWLPIEEWHSVTQREIDECRLPGEE